jgi:hypothetical protein
MIAWATEKRALPASLIKVKIPFVQPNTGNGLPARQSCNSIKSILPLQKQLTRPIQVLAPIGQEVVKTGIPVKSSNLLIGEQQFAPGIDHRDVHHNRGDVPPGV